MNKAWYLSGGRVSLVDLRLVSELLFSGVRLSLGVLVRERLRLSGLLWGEGDSCGKLGLLGEGGRFGMGRPGICCGRGGVWGRAWAP